MAPNLYILTRNIIHPKYWLRKGRKVCVKINGSITREEHWDAPVPGTYRYIPGQGWFLIRRDYHSARGGDSDSDAPTRSEASENGASSSKSDCSSIMSHQKHDLPEPVVYNSVLHRYILAVDLQNRLRRCEIPVADLTQRPTGPTRTKTGMGGAKEKNALPPREQQQQNAQAQIQVQAFWFLRLDDGKTWVAAWDSRDRFLPGPYLRWRYDRKAKTMKLQCPLTNELEKLEKSNHSSSYLSLVDKGYGPTIHMEVVASS
ncbi:hypothetical protein KEM55_002351 [Ascosphaera atra]|nr:hypothetical protein KEM55_002351 [Ascosphaera atra]